MPDYELLIDGRPIDTDDHTYVCLHLKQRGTVTVTQDPVTRLIFKNRVPITPEQMAGVYASITLDQDQLEQLVRSIRIRLEILSLRKQEAQEDG